MEKNRLGEYKASLSSMGKYEIESSLGSEYKTVKLVQSKNSCTTCGSYK